MLVGTRILLGNWELPAFFHVPSLDAPFRTLKEMEKLTQDRFGLSEWAGPSNFPVPPALGGE